MNKELSKPSIQDLITVDDYATLLNKTKRTVYNWIAEKRLNTYEMFGKTLLNRNERPRD